MTLARFGGIFGWTLLAMLLVSIVAMLATIIWHRRMYPYWRTQPVSWMTVLPAAEGVIAVSYTHLTLPTTPYV